MPDQKILTVFVEDYTKMPIGERYRRATRQNVSISRGGASPDGIRRPGFPLLPSPSRLKYLIDVVTKSLSDWMRALCASRDIQQVF
jgi:hypothetical protein